MSTKSELRLAGTILAVATAATFPTGVLADAGTGTPPNVGFHLSFPERLALGSTLSGTLRSDRPAALYHADITVTVGRRARFYLAMDGSSTTTPTRFAIHIAKSKRIAILRTVRRTHRRAVLSINVLGVLDGDTQSSVGHLRRMLETR